MEDKIRALTTDLRATKDNLHGVMDKIKTWRGRDNAAKKCGNHNTVAKGGSKAAISWTAGTFQTITLGLASFTALLLMTLMSTHG
jgi:hypothetical protein